MKNSIYTAILLGATFLLILTSRSVMAQQNTKGMNEKWKKLDQLIRDNLPESALKYYRTDIQPSLTNPDDPYYLRGQIYELVLTTAKSESDTALIAQAEDHIATAGSVVNKAIWQNLAAGLYERYLLHHRWQIMERTSVSTGTSDDIEAWSADQFVDKITGLYRQSLDPAAALQDITIRSYAPALSEIKNTEKLWPTIYDLLAHRANRFFSNESYQVTKPVNQFELNEELYYAPAKDFVKIDLERKATDSNSQVLKTLQTYQKLLAYHLSKGNHEALIEVELERLNYVHQKTLSPDKVTWLYTALDKLVKAYPNTDGQAVARVRMLQLQYDHRPGNTDIEDGDEDDGPSAPLPGALQPASIAEELERIRKAYPDKEAAAHASVLLSNIKSRTLSLQVESKVLPGENNKILVTYKNVGTAYFRLYKVPVRLVMGNNDLEDIVKDASKSYKPVNTWSVQLPQGNDYELHHTETLLRELEKGCYIITIGAEATGAPLGYAVFQATSLTSVKVEGERNSDLIVLSRKNGAPVPDAKVELFTRNWNNQARKYELKLVQTLHGDGNGQVAQSGINGNEYTSYEALVSSAGDTLLDDYYFYYRSVEARPDVSNSFIFTDRGIYRPGQTVYFKGIVFNNDAEYKHQVHPGTTLTVTLFDVNNEKLSEVEVTTNEYGSYQGKFVIPDGLLNGDYHITDDLGTAYFAVEEYKRPKFFASFDKLEGNYMLRQAIEVKGKATAYAGNAISDAAVKYRVVRNVRYPYPWFYYHYRGPVKSQEKEIANGSIVTDANGAFSIPFELMPDLSVDRKSNPVFTYTVSADITDINGETHTVSTSVTAGYDPYIIYTSVPENVLLNDLDSISISTKNLNEVPVKVPLQVKIAKLDFEQLYRKRLWTKPDVPSYSRDEYRKLFPYDEYEDESNPLSWKEKEVVKKWDNITIENGKLGIDKSIFKGNGYYLLEVVGKSDDGSDIKSKSVFHLYDPSLNDNPEKPLVIVARKSKLQPGDRLEMEIVAQPSPGHIRTYEKTLNTQRFQYSAENRSVRRNITEAERGGVAYYAFIVHNNRMYDASSLIDIPWTNKELNIEWATHRDKLLPGTDEEWTMTITGSKKDKVAAEMVSVLYDASLDAIRPHAFGRTSLYPVMGNYEQVWNHGRNFSVSYFNSINYLPSNVEVKSYDKQYPDFLLLGANRYGYGQPLIQYNMEVAADARMERREMAAPVARGRNSSKDDVLEEVAIVGQPAPKAKDQDAQNAGGGSAESAAPVRSNFNETAYFMPQLHTDANGAVKIKFKLPESLTTWKMMAFAHTKDMMTGYLDGSVIAQKDLMVQPNMPRFFRQRDEVVLSTKIANISEKTLAGTAVIEILDPNTLQALNLPFQLTDVNRSFEVKGGSTGEVSWKLSIPEARYEPVLVRIKATAGSFTDGEEHMIPVITNRVLVTETLPLPVKGSGEHVFHFDKLKTANSSTLLHKRFALEYTANPVWYAVQALPYLRDYPHDCSEQTFSKLYANAIAYKIAEENPEIGKVYAQWQQKDTAALQSNLQKNQELKSALLQETPWVLEADNESEQKRMIAQLFDKRAVSAQLDRMSRKLMESQNGDGGWPWFPGMGSSEFITQYILTGFGKLRALEAVDLDSRNMEEMVDKGIDYLDRNLVEEFKELKKYNKDWKKLEDVSPYVINYMYMRSFFSEKPLAKATQEAYDFYYTIAKKKALNMPLYSKGQMALITHRNKDVSDAAMILRSLKETALNNTEMGMYWREMPHGYFWYEAPVETQSLIIEAFSEAGKDEDAVADMKTWLLKQKQVQNWHTTKATADACYALLMRGGNWLSEMPEVTLQSGDNTYTLTEANTEAGSGYFKTSVEGTQVSPALGDIKVKVVQPAAAAKRVSWGAAYWQYFEEMDKITSAATPLSMSKKLFIKRNTASGPRLFEVNDNDQLQLGDRLMVRITLKADRDMEYLHLKDMRAAAFEPVDVLSGYSYNNGLGYYRSISDASVNFFFDRINKGTYVFEYDLFVNAKGNYSNGIGTIQCMYAPEFSAHTAGLRVSVE